MVAFTEDDRGMEEVVVAGVGSTATMAGTAGFNAAVADTVRSGAEPRPSLAESIADQGMGIGAF